MSMTITKKLILRSQELSLEDRQIFLETIRNGTNHENCSDVCMQDCNTVHYIPTISSLHLRTREYCNENYVFMGKQDKRVNGLHGTGMIKVFEEITKNRNFSCSEDMLAKIAIVKVQLASGSVTKIVKSKRVSFTNTIADLGMYYVLCI